MKRSRRIPLVKPGLVLLALVTVFAIGWVHRAFTSAGEPPRVVVISADGTPSGSDTLHGTLVADALPTGTHDAEVLSARDCAPDADGISHCLNELAIGSTRITMRHHHRMGEVPCLRPGETVTVMDEHTYADRQGS